MPVPSPRPETGTARVDGICDRTRGLIDRAAVVMTDMLDTIVIARHVLRGATW
ncbi:MAG: hypothetical protein R3C56_35915 [Pirellulaceae bacterium]